MTLPGFFTRKGWRRAAQYALAATGIGLLYLLSRMIVGDLQQRETLSWWILAAPMIWALHMVSLARMLARAELTDWKWYRSRSNGSCHL
jgi:hypothetical protein